MSPTTQTQSTPIESEAAALHRLVDVAKARGIKIIQNLVTNHHWATSASRPSTLHAVTLLSCDCLGFVTHGRCTHYAAILAYYCSLPPIVGETGPDGGGVALPVPADVVLSVVPAHRPVVEGTRVAYAGTRPTGPPIGSCTPTRSSSTASGTGSAIASWSLTGGGDGARSGSPASGPWAPRVRCGRSTSTAPATARRRGRSPRSGRAPP